LAAKRALGMPVARLVGHALQPPDNPDCRTLLVEVMTLGIVYWVHLLQVSLYVY
jgi:hypothetical protein